MVIAVIILVCGSLVGAAYRRTFTASGAPQNLAQREFGAAVALACGHGFVDTGYELTPALAEFLEMKRDRLSCTDDLPPRIPPRAPNLTQGLYRYYMSIAALVWMWSGVSWSGLTPLFGAAYGLTLVAAYFIFRLGAGRGMAVAGTAALMVSAVHRSYLPYLRDYLKAPFILTLIFIMARLAVGPLSCRRALGWSVAFGLVLGIGFGFRNDLLVNVLPWTAVVILCLPGGLLSNLRLKALCLIVSAAAFLVAGWPIVAAYSAGSNTGHVALLGLMTPFSAPLGIAGSTYDWGYAYLDEFASALINSYSYRAHGHGVTYFSKEYDQTALAYLLTIARHWPADVIARTYGSVLRVLELPFTQDVPMNPVPYGIHNELVLMVYRQQIRVLQLLSGIGPFAVAAALMTIAARSLRGATMLLLLVLYFAGYPAIQFHVRHFFHLELIGWWALAYLADQACAVLWRHRHGVRVFSVPRAFSWPGVSPSVARVGGFCAIATLVVMGPLLVLRVYQTRHVRELLRDAYLRAEREPVETVLASARHGRTFVAMPRLWSGRPAGEHISTEYLIAEFSPLHCDAIQVPVTFRYEAKSQASDFSHDVDVRVPSGDRSTFVFFPAFHNDNYSHFTGVELPAAEAGCLVGVSRMKKDRIPSVLLDISFTPRWQRATMYQTLADYERPTDGEDVRLRLYANPSWYPLRRDVRVTPFVLTGPHLEYRNAIMKDGGDRSLVIKGHPDTPYSPVLLLSNQPLPAGAAIVAQGEVRAGGIAFRLLLDGAVVGSVDITTLGPFEAVVSAPENGTYAIEIANQVRVGWLEKRVPGRLVRLLHVPGLTSQNDVTLTMVGWLPPERAQ